LSRQDGRFYCLYVDFRKAFDKKDHHNLFEHLQNKGVSGSFLNVLVNMFANLKSCVNIPSSNCVTNYFPCNIGNRQGDISSTTICSLFIDQLIYFARIVKLDFFIDNSIPDRLCLMFADDVANCADTVNRLQQQLDIVD